MSNIDTLRKMAIELARTAATVAAMLDTIDDNESWCDVLGQNSDVYNVVEASSFALDAASCLLMDRADEAQEVRETLDEVLADQWPAMA